jgi:flagellar biosynthesis protein FlhG
MVAKYLGIDIPQLGEIPEDKNIKEALKTYMPIIELYPSSPASQSLAAIAKKLDMIVDLFSNHTHRT